MRVCFVDEYTVKLTDIPCFRFSEPIGGVFGARTDSGEASVSERVEFSRVERFLSG